MTGLIGACGLALSAALLSLLLSEIGYKGVRLLSITAAFLLLTLALDRISDIVRMLSPLMDREEVREPVRLALRLSASGMPSEYAATRSRKWGTRASHLH